MNKSETPEEVNENCLEGLQCPECKSLGPYWIQTTTHAEKLMSDDGEIDTRTQETNWDDDSDCRCSDCQYAGEVKDFRIPKNENHPSGSYLDVARDGRFA